MWLSSLAVPNHHFEMPRGQLSNNDNTDLYEQMALQKTQCQVNWLVLSTKGTGAATCPSPELPNTSETSALADRKPGTR